MAPNKILLYFIIKSGLFLHLHIQENYGIDDASKVAKIKELYKNLDLSSVYRDYEERSYQELMQLIDSCSGSLPKDMFIAYAKRIYKRQK